MKKILRVYVMKFLDLILLPESEKTTFFWHLRQIFWKLDMFEVLKEKKY